MTKKIPNQLTAPVTFFISSFQALVVVIFFSACVRPAFAASSYWVGGGTGASAPAGGNWDNTTLDWSTSSSGSPTAAWGAAGSTAVFGGADGAYNVSVNATVNKPQILQFVNSGYTLLNATTPETITFNGTGSGAAPNIQVASGKTAAIGTNITITAGGTTIWGSPQGTAGGELDIQNGGTLTSEGGTDGMVGNGTLTSVKTGGKLNVSSAATVFILGSVANDNCTLSVDGGSVNFLGSSAVVKVGGSGTATSLTGTLIVNSGSFTQPASSSAALVLGWLSGNTGIVYLNGGITTVNQVRTNQGTADMAFNGGTLRAASANFASAFISGLSLAVVRPGGGSIDNNGFNITIGQQLLNSSAYFGGDSATDGGLVVTNSGLGGTLTLTGANNYNGPTIIQTNAYLATTTASTGAGAYTVNDGGALEVQVASPGGQLAMSSLTLGTSGLLTNVFTLGANASMATPAVAVSGALALNGTVTVNATGSGLTGPNTYVLLSYGSLTGSGSFVAGVLPPVTGFIASVTNDTAAGEVELVYTQAPQAVSWAVGNGNWDTSSLNWYLLGTSSLLISYTEGALEAAFDDSASGSSPITVTLTGDHSPSIVTNNSTKDYVFAGSGYNLLGSVLIKDGSSTLTLDNGNGNNFTSVAIKNGTLQVGNSDTNGSLGSSGGVLDNGTLIFNRTDTSLVVGSAISGSGGVVQSGSGSATLSSSNSYSGNTTISAGNLTTTTASTGAGAFTVANGATLGVLVSASGTSLTNSSLTLGTSTNIFILGGNGSPTAPVIQDIGALTVNGTVTVNGTGSGLVAGIYPLISYASISGSGSFVAGSLPVATACTGVLTNDTVAQELKLIYTSVTNLYWDAGNTANGATIDAGNGTWDETPGNAVWNDPNLGIDRGWGDSIGAIFGGSDGDWTVNLGTNVSPTRIEFANSGYTLSATNPQTISILYNGAGNSPNLDIDSGKTGTIGTNVTVDVVAATAVFGGVTNNAGSRTLIIGNGGTFEHTGNGSLIMTGNATVRVQTGGTMLAASTGTAFTIGGGASSTDNPILSVEGGTLTQSSVNAPFSIGSGNNGTLTITNGGTVAMLANVTQPMEITSTANAGKTGTVNLDGGTLSVNEVTKGATGNTAVFNFNGGTLTPNNANNTANFMSGLDTANVRNGGAVIDDGGFNVTIGQALMHSTIAGDNAADGGLTKLDSGTLTLTNVNTYTGNTTISNGTLALSGAGSIANSANISLSGASAILNVTTVTGGYTLAGGQTVSGIGTVTGSATVAPGAILAPGNGGVGALTINGNLTLSGNLAVVLNKSLSPSNNLCIVNGTLNNAGTGTVIVTNVGSGLIVGDKFTLFNQPLVGGNTLTIVSPSGVTFTNNLANDGSIQVLTTSTTASYPTNITVSVSGNTMSLSWPLTHLGWIAQSNSVSLLSTNFWFDIPNSQDGTNLNIMINPSLTETFFRLRHP